MIYLSPTTGAQTFTFIPRRFTLNAVVTLKDEETEISQTKNVAIGRINNKASINTDFSLENNKFYELTIKSKGSNWEDVVNFWNLITIQWENAETSVGRSYDLDQNIWNTVTTNWDTVREGSEVTIYKDRVFATSQTISQLGQEYYDLTEGKYKTTSVRDNTYKVFNG